MGRSERILTAYFNNFSLDLDLVLLREIYTARSLHYLGKVELRLILGVHRPDCCQ